MLLRNLKLVSKMSSSQESKQNEKNERKEKYYQYFTEMRLLDNPHKCISVIMKFQKFDKMSDRETRNRTIFLMLGDYTNVQSTSEEMKLFSQVLGAFRHRYVRVRAHYRDPDSANFEILTKINNKHMIVFSGIVNTLEFDKFITRNDVYRLIAEYQSTYVTKIYEYSYYFKYR